MSKVIDLEQHLFVTSTKDIAKICAPLYEMFNISFFRYLKLHANGKRIILSNNPDSIRYMYEQGNWINLWHDGNFPQFLKPGWYTWCANRLLDSRDIEDKIENDLISLLDVRHGVTLVLKNTNYYEVFSFDTSLENIYQADKSILMRFIYYFKDQAIKIINAGASEALCLSAPLISAEEKEIKQYAEFLNSTKINRYYLNNNDIYITVKEAACIRWLMIGKSVEEIAI